MKPFIVKIVRRRGVDVEGEVRRERVRRFREKRMNVRRVGLIRG